MKKRKGNRTNYKKIITKATITRKIFEGARNENVGEKRFFSTLLGSLVRYET